MVSQLRFADGTRAKKLACSLLCFAARQKNRVKFISNPKKAYICYLLSTIKHGAWHINTKTYNVMDYKIEIPEPCHEDWAQMTPDAQGRFCGN